MANTIVDEIKKPKDNTMNANSSKEKLLTKSDLVKHFLLGYSSETCYNYERLQALGRANASIVLLNRLYETKEEKSKAIEKYFVFFNTEPSFIGTVIHGIEATMEEQIANGKPISDEEVNSVRTGLMGPMAGIGDTVSQGIVYPILAGIGCSLALAGNFAGPILFEILYKVIMIGLGWYMYMLGYKQGKSAILNMLKENTLNKVTEIFSIIGLMVVGSMAYSRVAITSPLEWQIGEVVFKLQDVFNMLFPGFLPLLITLLVWWLTKKFKPTTAIAIIFAVGIVFALLGVITTAV